VANITIYLPAELADRVRATPGFPLSAICQAALREHFASAGDAGPLDSVKLAAGHMETALSELKGGIARLDAPQASPGQQRDHERK
jgi:hypothetical protein